jgi:hypothetical protein
MAESKYGKYIVTDLITQMSEESKARYAKFATRVLWMDDKVIPGAFQMNVSWYLKPNSSHMGGGFHSHKDSEIIGFFSSDPEKPYDLGAEIEFWLEDEKFILTKSCMIFVPPNMKHCPLILKRVDRPVFHFTTVTGGKYEALRTEHSKQQATEHSKQQATEHSKNIITKLYEPEQKRIIAKEYAKYAKRILWMDKDVVPGAFHMNTSWFLKPGAAVENVPHCHDDGEIIGFFGSDPEHPHDLGAEIEFWLGDEKHTLTKSAMIYVPSKMMHCPFTLKRVDRPIFHFTVVNNGLYIKDEKKK